MGEGLLLIGTRVGTSPEGTSTRNTTEVLAGLQAVSTCLSDDLPGHDDSFECLGSPRAFHARLDACQQTHDPTFLRRRRQP